MRRSLWTKRWNASSTHPGDAPMLQGQADRLGLATSAPCLASRRHSGLHRRHFSQPVAQGSGERGGARSSRTVAKRFSLALADGAFAQQSAPLLHGWSVGEGSDAVSTGIQLHRQAASVVLSGRADRKAVTLGSRPALDVWVVGQSDAPSSTIGSSFLPRTSPSAKNAAGYVRLPAVRISWPRRSSSAPRWAVRSAMPAR